MTLLEEIEAKCSPELIANKEHGVIAEVVSLGRTTIVRRLGGIGAIIDTLGSIDGPTVLDTLNELKTQNPAIKWGWVLLERGELDFGSEVTRQMIDSLVLGGAMTQEQADKIKSLAVVPAPVTAQEVITAMEGI